MWFYLLLSQKVVILLVQNYMELLVLEMLHELMHDYTLEEPSEQFELILTLSLNSLPPKYFPPGTSEGVKKSFLLDRQRRISVMAKVIEAIRLAQNTP